MGLTKKTLVILGLAGVGKATTTGCMLFKYGGIDMAMMEMLERVGIRDKNRRYGEAVENLRSRNLPLNFYTSKDHHVTITDANSGRVDCAILVIAADLADSQILPSELRGAANQLIIVINKMWAINTLYCIIEPAYGHVRDLIDWSEEQYKKIVQKLGQEMEKYHIPSDGDNIVEKSLNSPWYTGWKNGNESGTTLLEALEAGLLPPY